ncbi:MAG: alkaline phosphatase family protein, partial [Candidatus Erginobacter occultus]|nr:alkaline phosphatase family protein [Candidatus Erginobacter occultus]
MAMIPKVLLIGLDGADPDFVEAHKSELPFLSRLMREGVSGRLASTIPPITGPAWSSAMSGMNPGRTGVIGFQDNPGDRKSRLVHSQSVAVPRIWDVLSQQQRRVGVVAVPMTYPPQPVNGFMISGFLTPVTARRFTYPESLRAELPPDYRTSLDFNKNEAPPEYFLQRLYSFSRVQFQAIEQLIQNRDWDFFTFVISQTDWVQHIFFDRPNGSDIILRYFQYVDGYLDTLEKKLPPGAIVCVISDHGFGKKTDFHL